MMLVPEEIMQTVFLQVKDQHRPSCPNCPIDNDRRPKLRQISGFLSFFYQDFQNSYRKIQMMLNICLINTWRRQTAVSVCGGFVRLSVAPLYVRIACGL